MVGVGVVLVLAAGTFASAGHAATGRDFYISPSGNDSNAGMSPDEPWQTLAKVNAAALAPGDGVHLEGGAVFSEPLAPWAGMAGTRDAPIVFDSYGDGRATIAASIFLKTVSDLTFENLNVAPMTGKGVFSSATGDGVRGITLRSLTISDVPLTGVNSDNPADDSWLIEDVSIRGTGDSGVYFKGSHFVVADSTIIDTGTDASIAYPRHGIYAAGPEATIVDNTIAGFSSSGISLRFQNAFVRGNRISGGTKGVSFDNEATSAGVSMLLYNTISNVSDSGIVVATPASESFVVANNTIVGADKYGIYMQIVPTLTIANNVVVVNSAAGNPLSVRPPSSRYSESHNLWYSGSSTPVVWNGSARTFLTYRSLSGQGDSDLLLDPLLDAELGPNPGSPVIDAGTTAIDDSVDYAPSCDGRPFDYCGTAPDLGSTELPTPTIVSPPWVSGATSAGGTITTSSGSWAGSPTSYSYNWQRCSLPDGPCEAIPSADGPSYTLVTADIGSAVRAVVTASNAFGATAATTERSSVITAAPEPTPDPGIGPVPDPTGDLASPPSAGARVRPVRGSRARSGADRARAHAAPGIRVLHPRRLDPLDRRRLERSLQETLNPSVVRVREPPSIAISATVRRLPCASAGTTNEHRAIESSHERRIFRYRSPPIQTAAWSDPGAGTNSTRATSSKGRAARGGRGITEMTSIRTSAPPPDAAGASVVAAANTTAPNAATRLIM
jgi:hypothetical protein